MQGRADEVEIARQHLRAGNLGAAEQLCKSVLARKPRHHEANAVLGEVLVLAGRADEAERVLRRAASGLPQDEQIQTNLAIALMQQGRNRQAISAFQKAARLKPKWPGGCFNLGVALSKLGRWHDAERAFRDCTRLDPGSHQAWGNLGKACRNQNKLEAAAQAMERCLTLTTPNCRAASDFAEVLIAQGRIGESVQWLRQALQIEPGDERSQRALAAALNYASITGPDAVRAEHERWAALLETPAPLTDPAAVDGDQQRGLRIGYVSPDLREHSCASFFEPILREHDRDRFEVFCYAEVTKPDQVTERLRTLSDHWRSTVDMEDRHVAEAVVADRIDILVDLAGYSKGNRLGAFNWRPAPVQVTYLGYPNTTGMARVDYRLGDALTDPPGAEQLYMEDLVRLPGCFLCYEPPRDEQPVGEPPARKNGYVTFGSFNNLAKLSPETVDLWVRILQRVPGSRLLIKNQSMLDPGTSERCAGWFRDGGLEADRVSVARWTDTCRKHRNMYRQVDVALDTFPYHGTTTTCEALWMGVPVVTLAGAVHAARVGVSLLTAVGLEALVADEPDAYVEKAVELAGDPYRRAELRGTLRQRLIDSSLCNAVEFTRNLEETYRWMWQRRGTTR